MRGAALSLRALLPSPGPTHALAQVGRDSSGWWRSADPDVTLREWGFEKTF